MKTDKFNRMIEAFECDFGLAKDGQYSITELDDKVKFKDEKLMKDIELLEELSYLLRYGKAEIHLVDEPKTNADRIRNMTDEELAEFLEGFTVCDHCEYYKNERCAMENPCVHAFAEAMAFKWLQAEVEGDSE